MIARRESALESVRKLNPYRDITDPPDEEVIEQAIKLRQQKKMKLGDAITAATAVAYDVPLVTRNVADFKHIEGLDLRNPFAPPP